MRIPLVAGNWKMNGDKAMAKQLCHTIADGIAELDSLDVVICPPYTLLTTVEAALSTSSIVLGAQDVDVHHDGAFTGQISVSMLHDSGCRYVILGHSERRTLYGESDSLVADKIRTVLSAELSPILCVGETLEERQSGLTDQVVHRQIEAVIDQNGIEAFERTLIAYEPVWAIGTGLTATPDQAQQMHQSIRQQLAGSNERIADRCRILYGGSMKPNNAKTLISQPDVDGGLIGGASLDTADFLAICQAARQA